MLSVVNEPFMPNVIMRVVTLNVLMLSVLVRIVIEICQAASISHFVSK
jgi:hypothetical protein